MTTDVTRREVFRSTLAAGLAGAGGLAPSRVARAQPAAGSPERIPVDPEIEPLVKLLEGTPQEKLIPVIADQVARGLSDRRLLAAVFLKQVRGTSPHSVFVTYSAHQIGLDVAREDRLLPLMWAAHTGEGDAPIMLSPLKNPSLPPAGKAASALDGAIESFDPLAARTAILTLARDEGPRAAANRLWRWTAARCGTGIGHSVIGLANAHRTLEAVGWKYAEPVLQFLVSQHLLRKGGWPPDDELNRLNERRAKGVAGKLRPDWAGGKTDKGAVLELLSLLRGGNAQRACEWAHEKLADGKVQAASVWDAIFLGSAELIIRSALGGVTGRPLHSMTMVNALHYGFQTCADPETRFYLVLGSVQWLCAFCATERAVNQLRDLRITAIPEADSPAAATDAVDDIFGRLPPRRFGHRMRDRSGEDKAMELTYALARKHPHGPFFAEARRLICRKAVDAHDIKFPVALFENYEHVSAEWRPHLLAAAVHVLQGTRMEDSPQLLQAREEVRRRGL